MDVFLSFPDFVKNIDNNFDAVLRSLCKQGIIEGENALSLLT